VVPAELAEAFVGRNAGLAFRAVAGNGGEARMELAIRLLVFEIDLLFHATQVEIRDRPFVREHPQQRFERQRWIVDTSGQGIAFANFGNFSLLHERNGLFGVGSARNRQRNGRLRGVQFDRVVIILFPVRVVLTRWDVFELSFQCVITPKLHFYETRHASFRRNVVYEVAARNQHDVA